MPPTLLASVTAALRDFAEPARAPVMQAYMKSAMPYLGVTAPRVSLAYRQLFATTYPFATAAAFDTGVRALWDAATYREQRYVALRLTGDRRARAFQTVAALPLYEHLITTGAWWDYVDELAAHRIGPLLAAFPADLSPILRAWSRSPNVWLARTAILAQLTFKRDTDLALLYDCIAPSIGAREFFLRKAIGWALRQHARVDMAEVERYVAAHPELSGLSKREALKHSARARTAAAPSTPRSGSARARATAAAPRSARGSS